MKSLFMAALIALSTVANAGTPIENFLSVLPVGDYYGGKTLEGKDCFVTVQNTIMSDDIFVFAGQGRGAGVNIRIDNFSVSKFNPEKQDFLLTKRIQTGKTFIENGIRTFRASNRHLYVATWFVTGVSEVKESDKSVCVLPPNVI